MALADYRLCDQCGDKAFYDANLNYETGSKDAVTKQWAYPPNVFKTCGVTDFAALDYLGDWAVLCNECSQTHKCIIVPIEQADSVLAERNKEQP
jgi:hypothetical protein